MRQAIHFVIHFFEIIFVRVAEHYLQRVPCPLFLKRGIRFEFVEKRREIFHIVNGRFFGIRSPLRGRHVRNRPRFRHGGIRAVCLRTFPEQAARATPMATIKTVFIDWIY